MSLRAVPRVNFFAGVATRTASDQTVSFTQVPYEFDEFFGTKPAAAGIGGQ